ncbi:MAG: hypothetical protein KDI51_11420 [Xanthomonadales bacterium]|nr:hypothetical protein [Xanthomonadales bacterium]
MSGSEYALIQAGLPVKQKPGRDSFPTTARAVKLWIEALPLANSGATARLLYNGIKELNQLEVDPGQRLEILEQMRRPMATVAASMERHVVNQPLPLPAQKRQIGSVIRDFHRTLADGYRICVADFCAPRGNVPFLKGKAVALALTRALTHLSALLSKCYLIYAEVPGGIWQQAHQLLAFARSQSLHDKSVTDVQLPGIPLTAEAVYLQALLLNIANPYRLTQREIVDLEGMALIWSEHCQLRCDGGGVGQFLIDPEADSPPIVDRQQEGSYWRLDTSGLVKQAQASISLCDSLDAMVTAHSRLGHSPGSISAGVLSRLITAWDFSGDRAQARLPAGYPMDASLGLHSAHYLISGDRDFNEFVRQLSGGGIELSDRERSAAWAQASGEMPRPIVLQSRVLDQSLGGYKIRWEDAEVLKARVGELIALSPPVDPDEPRDWLVGVIRWLKGGAGNSLEAGVQLLSRSAEAVAVRIEGRGETGSVIHRGFLLSPLEDDAAEQLSLLVPSLVENDDEIEILRLPDPLGMDDRELCTRVGELRLTENTGAYKEFQFAVAGTQLGADPDEDDRINPDALDEIFATV